MKKQVVLDLFQQGELWTVNVSPPVAKRCFQVFPVMKSWHLMSKLGQ